MSEQLPKEKLASPSMIHLWNDKNQLASDIERLVKPFCDRYQLRLDQVTVVTHHAGIYVQVTV